MTEMGDSINVARVSMTSRIVRYWLPVVGMLGLIYYFSTDVFSGDNTRSVFEKIYLWFFPHAGKHAIETLNYFTRKSAHFTEYAVLSALLFRAYRADALVRWRFRWASYSLFTAVGWALLDELHQSFTRRRGGSIRDSLLDSSGALFMLIGIAIFTRVKARK